MKRLDVILIGAGGRGKDYTNLMNNEMFRVVAVAEPVKDRRDYIKEKHNIPDEMCFETWEPLLELPKMADIAVIATMDKMHYEPAMKAIEKKYNLLLEKPIAPTYEECVDIANYAKEQNVKILVCHVLRYSPFFRKIKDMINEGAVGKVLSVHHIECVGHEHQSHSFVRGNWGNSKRSSCMILQKCCHDMDIMQWLVGSDCKRVQSFGLNSYFNASNAPEGAPDFCIEGCPHGEECHYNAVKLYLKDNTNAWFRNAATQKTSPTDEDVEEALRTTQYGKCVYKCDNDVVDHQVVNLEFENGALASFNMNAFNKGGRFIRVMGTEGEINGNMETNTLEYFSFKTKETEIISTSEIEMSGSIVDGHGGGDGGIVSTLYKYIAEDYEGDMLSEIEISTKNHIITFAAEKSRLENRIIDIAEFEKEIGLK